MRVRVVGYTVNIPVNMSNASGGEWSPDNDSASALSEFAGRQCYKSWSRPNPGTATNRAYLANIIDQQHFSVLEHGSVSVHVTGVSRSLTHELVRHRHFSYSQLSQRFVTPDDEPIVPPLFENNDAAHAILRSVWLACAQGYRMLTALAEDMKVSKKEIREAARAVLPNMTPTEIVVTGNHRAWREFITKRATPGADKEMCRFAVAVYRIMISTEPAMYQDMRESDGYVLVG